MRKGRLAEFQPGLARAIIALRKTGRFTPGELANAAKLDIGRLRAIEMGEVDPEWSEVKQLARGLVVTLPRFAELAEYFVGKEDPVSKCPGTLLKGWARSRCQ